MKLVYQPLGSSSLVGIESDNAEEIQQQFWSFWNHGATNGELHEMTSDLESGEGGFAYIVTSEKQLEKYFKNSSLAMLLNELGEDFEGDSETGPKLAKQVQELASKRMEELKSNTEVFHSTNPITFDYSLGKVEARTIDAQVKPFDEEDYKGKVASMSKTSQLGSKHLGAMRA